MGHIWTRVDGGRISPKRPEQQVERRSALGKTLVVWPFQPRQGTGGEVGEPRRSRASRWSSWHDGASRSSMVRLGRHGARSSRSRETLLELSSTRGEMDKGWGNEWGPEEGEGSECGLTMVWRGASSRTKPYGEAGERCELLLCALT